MHMVVLHVVRLNFALRIFFSQLYPAQSHFSFFALPPPLPLGPMSLGTESQGVVVEILPNEMEHHFRNTLHHKSSCPDVLLLEIHPAVLSCGYIACLGHRHPHMPSCGVGNNIKIGKNTQRGDKNVTIISANIN